MGLTGDNIISAAWPKQQQRHGVREGQEAYWGLVNQSLGLGDYSTMGIGRGWGLLETISTFVPWPTRLQHYGKANPPKLKSGDPSPDVLVKLCKATGRQVFFFFFLSEESALSVTLQQISKLKKENLLH